MLDDYCYDGTLYLLLYLLSCSKQIKNSLKFCFLKNKEITYFLKNAWSFKLHFWSIQI